MKPQYSLSDPDVERLLKEAVERDSLEERDGLSYQPNESEPYSGWIKVMYDSGPVQALAQLKDGKQDGLQISWHENGRMKHGGTFKDGELVSINHYRRNSKGEEVETAEEAKK